MKKDATFLGMIVGTGLLRKFLVIKILTSLSVAVGIPLVLPHLGISMETSSLLVIGVIVLVLTYFIGSTWIMVPLFRRD